MKDEEFKWVLIEANTYTAKVPGGLLFRNEGVYEEGFSQTMCFVPCREEDMDWWLTSKVKNKK